MDAAPSVQDGVHEITGDAMDGGEEILAEVSNTLMTAATYVVRYYIVVSWSLARLA